MKFVFTQVDPAQPDRPFYFLIYVDDSNMYRLVETCPALDAGVCAQLLATLNDSNEIGLFVAGIRNLFCNLVR